jgi:hypothetical protein
MSLSLGQCEIPTGHAGGIVDDPGDPDRFVARGTGTRASSDENGKGTVTQSAWHLGTQYTNGINRLRSCMNCRYGSPITASSVRSSTAMR